MANEVDTGGCAWQTPPTSGFSLYTRRCILISLEGFSGPCERTVPSSRSLTRMSSLMNPLETPVGVAQMMSSSTLQLMLPSLAATKFF